MPKFFFDYTTKEQINAIGFDMDGTLYDELEFISQVYRPIACYLSSIVNISKICLYKRMIARWKEKGSSYNKIFSEILDIANIPTAEKKRSIDECLEIYRNYKPFLILSPVVICLLDRLQRLYPLFLITDGNKDLQYAKFQALNLANWFHTENVGITGAYGKDYAKPSTKILKHIDILQKKTSNGYVLYLGDRNIDLEFSKRAGFIFNFLKYADLKDV